MSNASARPPTGFPALLAALKAAGEPTRLRLLALLAEGELNVTDLTDILGQSQPRISRHLKLLAEAGLVERIREGSWAFFRLMEAEPGLSAQAGILAGILAALDRGDRVLARDRTRLAEVLQARAAAASDYFDRQAAQWDRIRALHAADQVVEAALRAVVGERPMQAILDIGTGTGRMLELFAPLAARATGVDASAGMLAVARANLERAGLRNVVVRQGDLFALPVEPDAYDLVILHQVLHYLDDGARAVREAARMLRPGGRLVVVDFAPHELESLRAEHAHRRLGFAAEAVEGWMAAAGLDPRPTHAVRPDRDGEGLLTVSIWLGRDRRVLAESLPVLEVA